jgi:hypothetical protein
MSTTRGGRSPSRTGSPQKKQTLREKLSELTILMAEEPKRRSSTGYAISDDLRGKWKRLGPLTVDMIQKHLNDWGDEDATEIEFDDL